MADLVVYSPADPEITPDEQHALVIAEAANQYAALGIIENYRRRKTVNTRKAHDQDLALFRQSLATVNIDLGDLFEPLSWRVVTWGLVEGFRERLLSQGYAVSTVNRVLSTIRTYARLAYKAAAISQEQYQRIQAVEDYSQAESIEINQARQREGKPTRRMIQTKSGKLIPAKKAEAITLDKRMIDFLKANHPDTPQGVRDRVLACLFFDFGLRASEIAGLTVAGVNFEERTLHFYRRKVKKWTTFMFTPDVEAALLAYQPYMPTSKQDRLLRSSRKGGRLTKPGMSENAISDCLNKMGRRYGIQGLSAHDGRHSAMTRAAKSGTDSFALLDFGGWTSITSAQRYVEAARIANERVKLD